MLRDGVLIFNSVHKVMSAEKALKQAGVDIKVMPVPRKLSSDCGLAISFDIGEHDRIDAVLREIGTPAEETYRIENEEYLPL